ncbi:MAG TPA: DEAD/DEAH box helicase [Trueperaceae bacterium]
MAFEDFGLHPKVAAGVAAAGYTTPTPIQQKTIPAALAGRDVLGLAQTGTGKTAAFVLPLLQRLIDGPRGFVRALIVAPTRELAEQIHGEISLLGRSTGLRSATVYGGVGKAPQIRALKGRSEIIVACPGRLLDHMQQRDADLSRLEAVVLDEADHMFDMGFLPAIKRIMKQVPAKAQRLLFSATMPDELRQLAHGVLDRPITVEIGRAAPAETVAHALYPVAKEQKTELLKHLLRREDSRSALVFTRTKHGAKRLAQQLDRENFFVTSLQGNLSQNKRQQALDGFRDGKFHIMVATDIAARGIDISRVTHVINYDVPSTGDAYTHRIGRTGRAARSGQAYTFVTGEDDKAIRTIERELGMRLERLEIDGFGYLPIDAAGGAGTSRDRGQRGAGGRRDNGRANTNRNGNGSGARAGNGNGSSRGGASAGSSTASGGDGKRTSEPSGTNNRSQERTGGAFAGGDSGSRRRGSRGRGGRNRGGSKGSRGNRSGSVSHRTSGTQGND